MCVVIDNQCRHIDGAMEPRRSLASDPMAALDLLPYLAAGLLLVAGAAKVRRPDTMGDVLAAVGVYRFTQVEVEAPEQSAATRAAPQPVTPAPKHKPLVSTSAR